MKEGIGYCDINWKVSPFSRSRIQIVRHAIRRLFKCTAIIYFRHIDDFLIW
ncbi:Mob1/phocein family protein [Listeria monocytogenes]|nr:hypothetical protein [Listeria monocytogenes]TYU00227.1 Mob1/phocein family protein [Listeria monocytogenes]